VKKIVLLFLIVAQFVALNATNVPVELTEVDLPENPCLFGDCSDAFHEEMVAQDIVHFDLKQNRKKVEQEFGLSNIEQELELLSKEPFINISLGWNCYVALGLNTFGLRIRSFPLDWNRTSFSGLCNLIENNLEGILELKNLDVRWDGPGLYNKYYDCWLAHDFHDKYKQLWKNNSQGYAETKNPEEIARYYKVCAYYERRIARFFKVLTLGVPVYMFRYKISSHEAKELSSLLKKKFPNISITLVCINDLNVREPIVNWQKIPEVKHFTLSHPDVAVSRNEWRNMFMKLGMIV